MTLRMTLEPEILTSTSASEELQVAPDAIGGGGGGGGSVVVGLGLKLFLLFLDSKASTTWCSSLMNSITPPIMDAWSPFINSLFNTHQQHRYMEKEFYIYHGIVRRKIKTSSIRKIN